MIKNEVVYIVVQKNTQTFHAVFDTQEAAEHFVSVVTEPTEIIESVVKSL